VYQDITLASNYSQGSYRQSLERINSLRRAIGSGAWDFLLQDSDRSIWQHRWRPRKCLCDSFVFGRRGYSGWRILRCHRRAGSASHIESVPVRQTTAL